MSLRDTRDIGTAKIVMLGGGGGGGSYTAGNGINITNNVIINTRKGALSGIIDSVSSNIAHTQIDNALTTTTAGALVVLKAEASGTSIDTVRVQYGSQASESNDYRLRDTSGNYTTIDIALDDTIIMMLNATGYQMILLSILGASTGGGYAGLGIGKKKTVTSNIIDTDIDLHRAPIVGDRLLIYFDEKVTNPTGLTTYNNGTAVTSNLENAVSLYINAGWNILEFKNDGLLYNNVWVRVQNVPVPKTLTGLSDTLIVSPSDGQMLAFDNSSSKWKNKTIAPNSSGTPVRELKTLQIGDAVFNAFGLKTFDVTSVTSGVNGAISVGVITASQLNGEIIAVHTGSNTGSTGNAWTLALSDGQTIEALTMSKADGTAFTNALTANSLMFVKCNISNSTATVLGIVGAGSDVSGNGSGSPASYLNKLKIGSAIYDTSAIRPFSVAQIANNSVKIYVADIDQLDGNVIALSTGALTGTTSSAWSLNMVDTSGGAASLDVDMLNADGTAFTDDISANELLFVEIDLTDYEGTILSVVGKSEDEIKTATGNPITLTDAIAGNAIEVSAEIVATQDLHGYDKPWVGGAGKNKLDFKAALDYWGATYTDNGDGSYTVTAIGDSYTNPYEFLDTATVVSISVLSIEALQYAVNWRIQIYDETNARWEDITSESLKYENITAKKIRLNYSTQGLGIIVSGLQIELGSTATSYEPYENICPITGFSSVVITDVDAESHTATVTVALGSTVYGGTLDLTSGELTVTHAIADLGSLDWWRSTSYTNAFFYANITDSVADGDNNIISSCYETIESRSSGQFGTTAENGQIAKSSNSIQVFVRDDSYNDASAFKTARTGEKVVYELATPTTTTLTAAQLALVKGYNQLSCNSGDMEITYKASGLDALKERVDELEDAVADLETDMASKAENSVVGTVENGTTASQPYAVGEHFIRNDKFCTCISAIASGATLTLNTNYVEGTIAECIARQGTYSTDEVEIGTWCGARLYRKGFNVGSLTGGQTLEYSTGLSNITVRDYWAMITRTSDNNVWKAPYVWSTSGQNIGMGVDAVNNVTRILLRAGSDYSGITGFAFLEYTKNS